jgi:hypothetical protein
VRLADSEPKLLLAEATTLERVTELGVRGLDVDRELPALLAAASGRFSPVATTPDTPALIV